MMTNNVGTQRNDRDIALELTKLYCDEYTLTEENELEERYAKFYALAAYLSSTDAHELKELIPEEILSKIAK